MFLLADWKFVAVVAGSSIGVVIFLIIFVFLLIGGVAFHMLFSRINKTNKASRQNKMSYLAFGNESYSYLEYVKSKLDEFDDLDKQPVQIKTFDGLTLKGFFAPAPSQSRRTIICNHGYTSTPSFDFAPIIPFLRKNNFNILFVTHRAHYESEGRYVGFGVLDAKDTEKWIEAVNELVPDGDIFLYGVSMGAATVMTASAKNLPLNVRGIIEDCGYSQLKHLFKYQIKNLFKVPSWPIVQIVESLTKTFAKYDLTTDTPIKAVAKSAFPILFIHGTNDSMVPAFMGTACYEACTAPKEFLAVEGAGHAMSYYTNPELYEETFLSFINTYQTISKEDDSEFFGTAN